MSVRDLPVGVLDSGVGGLTVVKELVTTFPDEDVIYFGDSKRMPYGNRSVDEIVHFANAIIRFLEDQGVKAILLACNTVSSQIDKLSSRVPLFGIIEAGCQAALESSSKTQIGLIATVATVNSGVYEETIKTINPDIKIISNDSRKLPKIINDHLERRDLLDIHIKQCIDPILDKAPVRELILGCSHFPIIEREIQELYPDLKLVNPARKQVDVLKRYLEDKDLFKRDSINRKIDIYATEGLDEFKMTLNRLEICRYSLKKVKLFNED